MLQLKVFKNYRKFDKDDTFKTKVLCDLCKKPSEQYLKIAEDVMYEPKFILICKGCLTRGIEKLDKSFIEHCKIDTRK